MKLREVIAVIERAYPPGTAEEWDAVGLVCGDPEDEVRTIALAMDPSEAVAEEAIGAGADLLITHHPLFLRGTSTVAATSAKGRTVHNLIRSGCALYNAHTNHDKAPHGTNDVLADLLGLEDVTALVPEPAAPLDTLITFVPTADADSVLDALSAAGAGTLGHYQRAAFLSEGTGTFQPQEGAAPTIGQVGRTETVAETRIEIVLPRSQRQQVVDALRTAHPYEEPAFTLVEQADNAQFRGGEDGAPLQPVGLGRFGTLPEAMSLAQFTDLVASHLPETVPGVLAGGPPEATVQRVALCSGAGDSLLSTARRAGADVYLTADLRHHPATDHLAEGKPYLVNATHFASEAVAMERMAHLLRAAGAERGQPLTTRVSRLVTDPWTYRSTKGQLS